MSILQVCENMGYKNITGFIKKFGFISKRLKKIRIQINI